MSIDAVTRFGWLQGPSVLLLTAVSVAAIMFYRISRARHAEILEDIRLNSRRKSSLESA